MLSLLHIENIAVVEKADIEFAPGFNALTGETGAGKSIVIDSLEAAVGWRTSRELVRRGAKSALVTAVFRDVDAGELLEELGAEDEEELILTRKISEDGKSAARVNGVPVSSAQLRELGLHLIDIHSQGDGQRLTDERYHRGFLDDFGGLAEPLAAYRTAYEAYRAVREEMDKLALDESEKERRLDVLNYQIEELERVGLKPGEYEDKLQRRLFMKSAGKLLDAAMEANAALSGGESSPGAVALIEEAAGSVERAARLSGEFSALAGKLNDLKFAAEDAEEELRELRERLDFSPEEMDVLDERLDALKRVLRKYGGDEESALAYLEERKQERDAIEYAGERLQKLEKELSKARESAEKAAGKLSALRKKAAGELSKRIEAELAALSMRGAVFTVELTDTELGPYGKDNVRFLMAANAGESVGRISKVASGGELSRIMLALKTVLAAGDAVQSMVFDEIDTGISGVAAQRVAEKMAGIARGKQVICVTHLPQLAAMADAHFSIAKELAEGRTYTKVTRLDFDGRKRELARLTGGDTVTPATLTAAAEQLEAAERFKREAVEE